MGGLFGGIAIGFLWLIWIEVTRMGADLRRIRKALTEEDGSVAGDKPI